MPSNRKPSTPSSHVVINNFHGLPEPAPAPDPAEIGEVSISSEFAPRVRLMITLTRLHDYGATPFIAGTVDQFFLAADDIASIHPLEEDRGCYIARMAGGTGLYVKETWEEIMGLVGGTPEQ